MSYCTDFTVLHDYMAPCRYRPSGPALRAFAAAETDPPPAAAAHALGAAAAASGAAIWPC